MQSDSSRIWTRVAVSISYDDNHYTTGFCIIMLVEILNHNTFGLLQVAVSNGSQMQQISEDKLSIAKTIAHSTTPEKYQPDSQFIIHVWFFCPFSLDFSPKW